MTGRLSALLVVLLMLTGVSGVIAQDTALADAVNRTHTASSYQFDYALDFTLTGIPNTEADVQLEGVGTVINGSQAALDISLEGQITVNGEKTPMNYTFRIVDGHLYMSEDGQFWSGVRMDELGPLVEDLFVSNYIGGFNSSSFEQAAGQLESGSTSDPAVRAAITEITAAIAAFDLTQFMVTDEVGSASVGDEATTQYSSTLSLKNMLQSSETYPILEGLLRLGDPENFASVADAELAGMGAFLGQIFDTSTVTMNYYVDATHLRRAVLNLDFQLDAADIGSPGLTVGIIANLDVIFRDFDGGQVVEVPAGAFVVSDLAGLMGLESPIETEPTPTSTPLSVAALLTATPSPTASTGEATPITANEPVEVMLEAGTPSELVYTTQGDETITIVAQSLEEPGTVDTTLEIVNAEGLQLAYNDDHSTDRSELYRFDSVVEGLILSDAGTYTIRISSFSSAAEGRIQVTVENGTQPVASATSVPPTAETPVAQNTVITETVPQNDAFVYPIEAQAGQVITITVRAASNSALDPQVRLVDAAGEILAENDDHTDPDPTLSSYDSRILDFSIPETGSYTIEVSGFAGTGGDFELTIDGIAGEGSTTNTNNNTNTTPDTAGNQTVEGEVSTGGVFTYSFSANAGDVITLSAISTSDSLDPQLAIYDADGRLLRYNDDHSTSNSDLGQTDSQIQNFIAPTTGQYEVEVSGYGSSSGTLELAFELTATDGPTGSGEDEVFVGEVGVGEIYTQTFTAQAGDYVTVSVRALSDGFDPQLVLLGPDNRILADNDDHRTPDNTLGVYDSLIENVLVTEDGEYTVEVVGYENSSGNFAVTVVILR